MGWCRVVVLLLAVLCLEGIVSVAPRHADSAPAPETRQLKVVKVAASPDHPGGTFGGSIGSGVGSFSLQLAPGASRSNPLVKTMPTVTVGIAESTWPAGWSNQGYALVPDPSGVAVCGDGLSYGAANIIPAGSTPYLVCIKNGYASSTGSRILRLGVTTLTPIHPVADFGVTLSTGQQITVRLQKDQSSSSVIEVLVPASSVGVANISTPVNWWVTRQSLVDDPTGQATCLRGTKGPPVPAGPDRYLLCVEAVYYSPDLPRGLIVGVITSSVGHPGGTFEVEVLGSLRTISLTPGSATRVLPVVTIPPPGSASISFRATSPGWHIIGYGLWGPGGIPLPDPCAALPPVSPSPGNKVVLGEGSSPFLLCIHVAYLPKRVIVPAVARAGP
ncbi:MAG: hypothetical protein HY875_00790 [Chloroflexi bacterium]|nr:hypothetical protein [Chloroflexota bacterium]